MCGAATDLRIRHLHREYVKKTQGVDSSLIPRGYHVFAYQDNVQRGTATMEHEPAPSVSLFHPPYQGLTAFDHDWSRYQLPPRGLALVWNLASSQKEHEDRLIAARPYGVPLFVILPDPEDIQRVFPVLRRLPALNPRAVIPCGLPVRMDHLRRMLADPPTKLPTSITSYLYNRGVIGDRLRSQIERVIEYSAHVKSVAQLARRMYVSRRTLGRHFVEEGVPVPSHWLQFARLLRVGIALQVEGITVGRAAARFGYPDGFTLSNQMKRLLDCRPSEIKELLGWEWIVETWISQEAAHHGFDTNRYGSAIIQYTSRLRKSE